MPSNATLAALLAKLTGAGGKELAFDIRQGVAMGRPSRLHATAWASGKEVRASVAGSCVEVFLGSLEI